MPGWRIQVHWWGVVNGYPSSLWKTIEEHDDESAAKTSLKQWVELHGRVASYRAIDRDDKVMDDCWMTPETI
jgi:hypothetical protein